MNTKGTMTVLLQTQLPHQPAIWGLGPSHILTQSSLFLSIASHVAKMTKDSTTRCVKAQQQQSHQMTRDTDLMKSGRNSSLESDWFIPSVNFAQLRGRTMRLLSSSFTPALWGWHCKSTPPSSGKGGHHMLIITSTVSFILFKKNMN